MKFLKICDRAIEYSFYAIFLLVPLVLASDTSELFEFNKMWLTFALTIIIGASWFIKMVLQKRVSVKRTPLDIPIVLFLLSQVISTIFSYDTHISVWGYYSRFNGGLLSIISYIFLYYAFVNNLDSLNYVKRLLKISLVSGAIVALWGLPSHFGYDPTCLLFRGSFDVSCWTADFQPKIRIFSTLGQPDWLAAYLAILIPIAFVFALNAFKHFISSEKKIKELAPAAFYAVLTILFYIDLLYTRSRSGILALWISLLFLAIALIWYAKKNVSSKTSGSQPRVTLAMLIVLAGITFFIGQPFPQLDKFTFEGIRNHFLFQKANSPAPNSSTQAKSSSHAEALGGTDSGKIRLLVWRGAIDAWLKHPLFGTGVETFAFAYYKYKLPAHNLTSEWNFLYNKAHNEYLNYLATTGIVGLGTYLLMIGVFVLIFFREIYKPELSQSGAGPTGRIILIALFAGYFSILISNFFGFSVVIVNVYLFIIPGFVFVLSGQIKEEKTLVFPKRKELNLRISNFQWLFTLIILILGFYWLFLLFIFWNADKAYAYGYNLDRAGDYQGAYPYLHKAVSLRGDEPVFKDELSINDAVLAAALLTQKNQKTASAAAETASILAKEAITTSNEITSSHPHNVVFWKSRVRVFYTLAQVDSKFLPLALDAIKKASILSPNDASISYNLGVLYGQNGDIKKAIEVLNNTVKLKPDYRDAYYALGLFYHQEAVNKNGIVVNKDFENKAVEQMQYILTHIATNDAQAKEALKTWTKI